MVRLLLSGVILTVIIIVFAQTDSNTFTQCELWRFKVSFFKIYLMILFFDKVDKYLSATNIQHMRNTCFDTFTYLLDLRKDGLYLTNQKEIVILESRNRSKMSTL